MRTQEVDPKHAVMAVLAHRFADTSHTCAGKGRVAGSAARACAGLTPFQSDAVRRISAILDRRGGAILADSVGLGKTLVARALIEQTVASGGRMLVCGPAALRRHWTRHLAGVQRWTWASHTTLSRRSSSGRGGSVDLIVVDEAHAFRNPRTRRYRTLAALVVHARARLLLLTATPVNNIVHDFYHLVRLFAARDAFADVGVPDLLGAADAAVAEHDVVAIRRVVEQVMVRRTRATAERWQQSAAARSAPVALRFPRRARIEKLRYDLELAYPGLLQQLPRLLSAVSFAAHTAGGNVAASELLRLALLKRLESSTAAFVASLTYHIRVLEQFLSAAAQGLLFSPRVDRDILQDVGGAVQLPLSRMLLRPWPESVSRRQMQSAAGRDLALLRELHSLVPAHAPDPKLRALRDLMRERFRHDKVVAFTEYRETAIYLWRQLCSEAAVALIHGGEARIGRFPAPRLFVVDRFAPMSNRARRPRAHERIQLLIATDVLAEGMNLQDARVVVSYDMPWNPVKLAQRVGRIDRLGSPHATVAAVAFWPCQGVEELLGVVRRIRSKVRAIRTVGGDAPHLGSARAAPEHDDFTATSDAEWDTLERLRYEFVRRTEPLAERITAPRDTTFTAGVRWQQSFSCTLCCFSFGAATRFVLARAGRAKEVSASAADVLLLRALDSTMIPVDDAHCRRTIRLARQKLLPGPVHGTAANDVKRQLARALHQWLHDCAAELRSTDIAAVDEVLRTVDTDGSVAMEQALRRIIRGKGTVGEQLQELKRHTARGHAALDIAGSRKRPARRERQEEAAAPRPLAVLFFGAENEPVAGRSAPL